MQRHGRLLHALGKSFHIPVFEKLELEVKPYSLESAALLSDRISGAIQ